ncbi:MAG: hypothetical protein ACPLZD_00665 [Candidatus Saccharicenans sp.]
MRRVRFNLSSPLLLTLCLTLILAAGSACRNPFSPLEDIDRIPEVLMVNSAKITMEVHLYLDLMPGAHPEGSPLHIVVFLKAEGLNRFPDYIGADKVWVTNGTETWTTQLTNEERPYSQAEPNKIAFSASGGPKWEVGTKADVVVRVIVSGKGDLYLRSLNNIVGAVW